MYWAALGCTGLHKGCTTCGSLAAGLQENGEDEKMKRKWRENGEMKREWGNGERFTL